MVTLSGLPGKKARTTVRTTEPTDSSPWLSRAYSSVVPRPERALDPEADPLQRFAFELRQLRRRAGGPTYRELARRANYSATVLAEAAGGVRLPTLAATLAYVVACGGDQSEWESRWRALAAVAGAGGTAPGAAELPGTVDVFTGRESALARVRAWLGTPGAGGAPRIVIVHGTGGVGKTALAIHSGHQVADRFPDGQLFANLHGYADGLAPRDPIDVLGGFLRGMGLAAAEVPSTVEEAAARYRSMLARRRILVVLDNARDSAQVRPLLPGGAGCAVLVTSRVQLLDLDGTRHLLLDVLPQAESVALLRKLAGHAGSDELDRLAQACGHLPLALRIAGARLAARPTLTAGRLADRLVLPQRRLDELRLGDLAVRSSFELSYRSLSGEDQRAYRMLSLLDGPDFGPRVAAAQLDLSEPAAEEALDRLVREHLVEEPTVGRYRLHDLLRLFGRERADQVDPDPERVAALDRVLRCYLAAASGDPATFDWLDTELPGILAAAQAAATGTAGTAALVPELAIALYRYLLVRPHWRDWESLDRLALDVARRLGDEPRQARLLDHLGVVCRKQFHLDEALTAIEESLRVHEMLGDRASQAHAWNSLGNVHFDRRRYGDAVSCLRRSLALRRALDDRAGEATALANLANVLKRTGRNEEALDACAQSLAIWRDLGDLHREAIVLCSLGEALVAADRVDEALRCYRQGHQIACDFGDRHGQAYTLVAIGEAHRRAGRLDAALAACERGLVLDREIGDRWGEGDALHRLGLALRDRGDRRGARARWRDALRCFEEIDAPDSADVLADLRALENA